jgi:N-methylhydantoinase A
MVSGIEGVTVERGLDPRNFTLSGGGGALGMFAVPLARELQLNDILLPSGAGVVSALGGLASDLRRDFSASNFVNSDRFDTDSVNETLSMLEEQAISFFERVGIPEDDRDMRFYAEGRYPQQVWELELELPVSRIDQSDVGVLTERFEKVHESTYGFRTGEPVEFLSWRVEAIGETRDHPDQQLLDRGNNIEEAQYSKRDAIFEGELHWSEAYRADLLSPGHQIEGPAFVDGENTTVVLPPDSSLTVTEAENYHIQT